MTRTEFEQFRDLRDKTITSDISFSEKRNHPSILTTPRLPIVNSLDVRAELEIHYNPDEDSKIFVVLLAGEGPICRLCVDGGPHGLCESSHKHGLITPDCPRENLKRDVQPKPELDGFPISDAFAAFCQITNISHTGSLQLPRGRNDC
jgi:hypothetical protein